MSLCFGATFLGLVWFGLVWFRLGLVWFGLGLVLILDSLLRELDLRKTKLYLKLGAYQ